MQADQKRLVGPEVRKGFSLKHYLLRELGNAKKRIYMNLETPHPYCELDCPWLSICRQSLPPACILPDLLDSNTWMVLTQTENHQTEAFGKPNFTEYNEL
ncbi:MAG: hypothetical protein ACFFFG_11490 [Candidatus Thorarchaeota archaeon]